MSRATSLQSAGLLGAPIRRVGDAIEDPATRELGLLVDIEGHPGIVSTRVDGQPHNGTRQRVHSLGEHQNDVLNEILSGKARP